MYQLPAAGERVLSAGIDFPVILGDLLVRQRLWTTETVLAELNRGIADYPLLGNVSGQEWLLVAGLDSVAEIRLYGTWLRRLGSAQPLKRPPLMLAGGRQLMSNSLPSGSLSATA